MKNSKELCHPLCLPYDCRETDTQGTSRPEGIQRHYFAEIVLVLEGRLLASLDGEEKTVSPGEVLMICPGVAHEMKPPEGEPARVILIRLDPNRLPDAPAYAPSLRTLLIEAGRAGMPMVIPAEEARKMELPELCAQCVEESTRCEFGYDLNVTARLTMIWVAIIRYWVGCGLVIGRRELQPDPIYSLSGYIQAHLRDGLRVESLAEHCGLSYPWFAKRFREIYGISCKDFIEQIRVGQVEQLLMFTDLDLNRISEETGYADCSHMIKNFKRIMNITPGQYRLKRK